MNVREYGVLFATGKPVSFRYVRNTEKSEYFGSRFQQDIEPTGIYLLHNPNPGDLPPRWVAGEIVLKSPLLVPFNLEPRGGYDESSWKAILHRRYGKKRKALSRALLGDGYDSVVTVSLDKDGEPYDTREIVVLRV